MNDKKLDHCFVIGFLCVLIVISLMIPTPGNRTWTFNGAIQTEPTSTLVACRLRYRETLDAPYRTDAKWVEMTLEGKGGKLTLTDQTNGVTYEGWYVKLPFLKDAYRIKINGKAGYATVTIGAPSILTITVDGYRLTFMTY